MSLKSMTGYGSANFDNEDVSLSIEIRTVNSKYLDISYRTPSAYIKLENDFSNLIKSKLKRSRLDLIIQRRIKSENSYELDFNQSLFNSYFKVISEKASSENITDPKLHAFRFALNQKDIVSLNFDSLIDGEKEVLLETLSKALDTLIVMREKEGQNLEKEILSLKKNLVLQLDEIKKESKSFNDSVKEKLKNKIEKFQKEVDFDEQRVAQEIAFIIDKADIAEEIARIESHFEQLDSIVAKNQGGKKIEFLLQEFFREFNTIGSKSQSSKISSSVIEAKSIIDRIKEQVANVE